MNEKNAQRQSLEEQEPVSWKDLVAGAATNNASASGTRDTKSWAQLNAPSEVFPEYKNRARAIIRTRLGYLPSPSVNAAYDTFLRSAAHAMDHGHLKLEQYDVTAEELVKQIRNKDMLLYDDPEFSQSRYAQYEAQKNTFSGLFVKGRIANLLGETLDIKITLPAELFLRFMVDEGIQFGDEPNELDIKALTIIGYRKELLENGKDSANRSPLWYYEFAKSNGYFDEASVSAKIPNVLKTQ